MKLKGKSKSRGLQSLRQLMTNSGLRLIATLRMKEGLREALPVLTLIAAAWLFLLPAIASTVRQLGWLAHYLSSEWVEWGEPAVRTIGYALITTVVAVCLGFFLATQLIGARRGLLRALPICLLPLLAGAVSVSFLWKMLFLQNDFGLDLLGERRFIGLWGLLLLIQITQYVPAFAFLFAVRLYELNGTSRLMFGQSEGRDQGELRRDVYWPHCSNLAGLLSIFCLAHGFQEFVKLEVLIRASPGTGSELLAARLARFFRFYSPVDPVSSIERTLALGIVVTLLGVVAAVLTSRVTTLSISSLVSFGAKLRTRTVPRNSTTSAVVLLLLFLAIMPLSSVFNAGPAFSIRLIEDVGVALFLGSAPAALGCLWAIAFAFIARVYSSKIFHSMTSGARRLLSSVFCLYLVPPLVIVLCGMDWLGWIGTTIDRTSLVSMVWIGGSTLLVFPLMSAFIVYLHFGVRNEELEYQRLHGVGIIELARFSFVRRYRDGYLLAFIFGVAFVLAEASLSGIMAGWSPWIPSLSTDLLVRVSGRGGSFSDAAGLLIVGLLPSAIGIGALTWRMFLPQERPA